MASPATGVVRHNKLQDFSLFCGALADSIEIITNYALAHSMKRPQRSSTHLLALLIALVLALLTPQIYADGGEDWVLVKRFQEQQQKATSGDAQAMYEVGRMYERGRGTEANMKQAVLWFERAAQKGQSSARARLGILYLEGQGVPQDYTKAYENLSSAAKDGVPAAQYFLALMYEEGHGVRANSAAAMTWYKKAAEGGYYQAQKGIARLEAEAKRPTLDQPPDTAKAKPQRKAAKPKISLAQGLMETILNGKWQRNGKAVGYLPSAATNCKEDGKEITCVSGELTRSTGFSTITYVTEATLSGFSASDEFSVSYHNNVLRAESQEQTGSTAQDDSEEFSAARSAAQSRVKLGRQKTEHHLECSLESAAKLVCVKNLVSTLVFQNKPE